MPNILAWNEEENVDDVDEFSTGAHSKRLVVQPTRHTSTLDKDIPFLQEKDMAIPQQFTKQ